MNDISQWIDGLNSPAAADRAQAAEQLSRLGEECRGAAVPLAHAAGDDDEQVREWAAAALEEMGPPAAEDCAALIPLLTSKNSDVAYWGATLLGRLAERAAPAAGALSAVLVDQATAAAVQQRAAWALGKIGPAAATARPALEQASRSRDARLARLATKALEQISR